MLQEGAIDLVADHVPPTSHADLVAGLLEGQRQPMGWASPAGRTPSSDRRAGGVRRVQRLGRLTAGVRLALLWNDKRGMEQVDEPGGVPRGS